MPLHFLPGDAPVEGKARLDLRRGHVAVELRPIVSAFPIELLQPLATIFRTLLSFRYDLGVKAPGLGVDLGIALPAGRQLRAAPF